MKKYVALMLALVLVCGTLAACGGSSSGDSAPAAEPAAASQDAAPAAEPAAPAAEPAAPAEAATADAAPAGGDTSQEAYTAYLHAYVDACPAIAAEQKQEFYDAIDGGDYTVFPADMLFGGFFGEDAMSYDDFVAAGGNYTLPSFDGVVAD